MWKDQQFDCNLLLAVLEHVIIIFLTGKLEG